MLSRRDALPLPATTSLALALLTLFGVLPGLAFTGDDHLEPPGVYNPNFFAELQDVELAGIR